MKHAVILTKKEFLDIAQSNALVSPSHIIHADSDINCYMLRFDSESAAERFHIIYGEHPLFDKNDGVDYVSADVFLNYAKDVLFTFLSRNQICRFCAADWQQSPCIHSSI